MPRVRKERRARATMFLAGVIALLFISCGGGGDDVPLSTSESGEAPIFWRTADDFASLRAGEAYKVVFRITNGYTEDSLRIDAASDAGGALELEAIRSDVSEDAPGSYYPLTFELLEPGDWRLTVFAGEDEVTIPLQAAAVAACETPQVVVDRPPAENQFQNANFEEGYGPWCSLGTPAWGPPFSLSTAQAHSGQRSALLELRSGDDARSAQVYGVVTEIAPEEFPEVLSGYYYVDGWEQGTAKQYMQFVVIVWEADNIPPEIAVATNHQVRYVLAGVDSPPIEIANARFVMAGTGEPEQGRWVRFERNIREDFEELWGAVPEGFSRLRILFEVRWDERTPADAPSAADVYYDDLYIGPAAEAP